VKKCERESTQARSQVLSFEGGNTFLGEQDLVIICSKQIYLGTTKFGGTKNWGTALECPQWLLATRLNLPDSEH